MRATMPMRCSDWALDEPDTRARSLIRLPGHPTRSSNAAPRTASEAQPHCGLMASSSAPTTPRRARELGLAKGPARAAPQNTRQHRKARAHPAPQRRCVKVEDAVRAVLAVVLARSPTSHVNFAAKVICAQIGDG